MQTLEPEKKFDWEAAKVCLAELQLQAPQILEQAVIIGGMACWFYRHLLTRANDPIFKVPILSPADEALWLSKDIDFTNFFIEDARQLLKPFVSPDSHGRPRIQIAGIPVGFAQVGVTLDPEVAWLDSWIGSFSIGNQVIQFRVLDPISLYREKQALGQKRGARSDEMHCALVAEYIRFETCQQVDALIRATAMAAKTAPLKFLATVRDRAPEVCRDSRVYDRIERLLLGAALTAAEQHLVRELASPPDAGPVST